jgi:hypothetical protein
MPPDMPAIFYYVARIPCNLWLHVIPNAFVGVMPPRRPVISFSFACMHRFGSTRRGNTTQAVRAHAFMCSCECKDEMSLWCVCAMFWLHIIRVGQNHIYTVYIQYFWQGNFNMYGHIRCIYTVLANPTYDRNKQRRP